MKQLLLCLSWLLFLPNLTGQDVPRVTNKIFLENVHLNVSPGQSPYIGNILVEDGIISQVGTDITAPFNAKVIKGDSMYVYAGFIAPLSHIGLKKPKESNEQPKVDRTGYPPNDVAGITPEKEIDDLYKKGDRTITDFRKEGFTIAHSVPYGKMLPGMGSVISLNGNDFNNAVILDDHSMYATWNTSRGVFPATLIGIMSKWRELYRNATLADGHAKSYRNNPQSKKRPSQDAATEALFPVINKNMPVFFIAEKHRDIARTLQLQKDLGFNLVISEARDIDRILSHTKSSGAKVLLSLDLPKEEKPSAKADKDKPSAKAYGNVASAETDGNEPSAKVVPDVGTPAEADEKEEPPSKADGNLETDEKSKKKAALDKRKKEAIARYVSQAKTLSSQGVPVSFSYIDTKAKEVHPNLRRLVKDGLSEAHALAALTTEAAATLGISNIVGTLEHGKIGNIVMSTGPIFDEKSKIKMVLVDGQIHKYDIKEKKKKKPGDEEEPVDVSGMWSYSIDVPGMTPSGSMKFTKNDDSYDIEITSNQRPGESITVSGVEIEGSNMTFNYSSPAGGMNLLVDNDITFDGESFEGTVDIGDFGNFEITGQKDTPE